MDIVRGRHSVGGSIFHMQYTPKYRRRVFCIRAVRVLIAALIRHKVFELGVRVEAIEFGPDHVHIFITNCRKYGASYLANQFKVHMEGYKGISMICTTHTSLAWKDISYWKAP